MDLKTNFRGGTRLHYANHDVTDPISVMPKEVRSIELSYKGKRVDIEKTIKLLFEKPSFLCEGGVSEFWELLIADPGGYVIDLANQYNTPIITK